MGKMLKLNIAFIALPLVFGLASCDKLRPIAPTQEAAAPTEEAPKVRANFDVDLEVTNSFKNDLLSKFPENSATADVEADLKTQNYDCGPDPTKETDRACVKTETKDTCILMTIVRTQPYTPTGAQVIKVCNIAK